MHAQALTQSLAEAPSACARTHARTHSTDTLPSALLPGPRQSRRGRAARAGTTGGPAALRLPAGAAPAPGARLCRCAACAWRRPMHQHRVRVCCPALMHASYPVNARLRKCHTAHCQYAHAATPLSKCSPCGWGGRRAHRGGVRVRRALHVAPGAAARGRLARVDLRRKA